MTHDNTAEPTIAKSPHPWAVVEDGRVLFHRPGSWPPEYAVDEGLEALWRAKQKKPLTFGSLFAGIGGLDLGLERAGMSCAFQVEIDDYATRVLEKHWPNVPKFRDVRGVGAHNLPAVDLLCGGFPCQDISNAGQRSGLAGSRSGLWTEYYRIIRDLRPRYIVVENVSALLDRGIDTVLGDLAAGGYDAEWSVLSSCAMGAPHTRERVFIVAYAHSVNGQARVGTIAHRALADERRNNAPRDRKWELPTSPIPRGNDGIPHRMERIGRLGNAVDPRVAEFIGRQIVAFDAA